MPSLHSSRTLALRLRVACSQRRWEISHLTPSRFRVEGTPLAPGASSFVQIDLDDGVSLGLAVTAGAVSRTGRQVLTACSDEDRRMLTLADLLTRTRPLIPGTTATPREVPDVA